MDIFSIDKSKLSKSDLSAVGFYFNGSEIFHVGLLYLEDPMQDAMFLHLARHHAMRTEVIDDGFWIRLGLTERQKRLLAGQCAMISTHNTEDSVPFSIFYDDNRQYFDEEGNYVATGLGDGLTCATFIMAIFETLGIPLLRTDNWTIEADDKLWHIQIINSMRQGSPNKSHFDKMSAAIGCARYRPPDIVIASSKVKGRPLQQKVVRRAYGALYKKVKFLAA